MAQTQLTVPVRDGYDFGVGADLLSGAPMNKPVNSDGKKGVDFAEGATVNFVVQRIQTTHDLREDLQFPPILFRFKDTRSSAQPNPLRKIAPCNFAES